MGIHNGHRKRLKERFLKHGLDNFDDHNVLELLLFYSIPREDTNPIAHRLIERFGSVSDVFDAPFEELKEVDGIGENTAALLKIIPQISRRYMISKTEDLTILDNPTKAGEYLLSRFYAERDEVVYIICLDAKYKVLYCGKLFHGSVNSTNISVRKIVEAALNYNATSVILAHNHASGVAVPSEEDAVTTIRVRDALAAVDIVLSDHIVVADDDFISFADSGFFDEDERKKEKDN